jgi:hypothetical protein
MDNQLYTPARAADILCVAAATLRKWRWEGKGPRYVKIGRKVAYRIADINAFIEAQIRDSTSDR